MNEVLKTSEEWQNKFLYPKVLDPDGWHRDRIYQFEWYEEKISELEYYKRRSLSTCMYKFDSNE